MDTVVASKTIRTSSDGIVEWTDPTSAIAQKVSEYDRKMQLVEHICKACSPDLSHYIFETVTRGATYTMLLCACNIPCSRSSYCRLLRKFFWMLDKVKE